MHRHNVTHVEGCPTGLDPSGWAGVLLAPQCHRCGHLHKPPIGRHIGNRRFWVSYTSAPRPLQAAQLDTACATTAYGIPCRAGKHPFPDATSSQTASCRSLCGLCTCGHELASSGRALRQRWLWLRHKRAVTQRTRALAQRELAQHEVYSLPAKSHPLIASSWKIVLGSTALTLYCAKTAASSRFPVAHAAGALRLG